MEKRKIKLRISFNSPVVLTFSIICLVALLLNYLTNGWANNHLFSVHRFNSSFLSPLTYIRFFGHVVGHASWDHFIGNITFILVIGPLLEEKYGSSNILFVILTTTLITGIVNFVFFPYSQLLGASGIVFAFILLSSFASIRSGSIPLTFILVAAIYIGEQVYAGLFIKDNIAHLTHILGGLTGASLGYVLNKGKLKKQG